MSEERKAAAQTAAGMDEMLSALRLGLKRKIRSVYTFEEHMNVKLKELKNRLYLENVPADNWLMRRAYYKGVGKYDYIDSEFRPIKVGEVWGGKDISCFFKQTVRIPSGMKGKKVVFQLYFGGDSLLYINGVPYHGMDPFRNIVPLTYCAAGDEVFDISVESYYAWSPGESKEQRLECSCISSVDSEIEQIYWDYNALYNAMFIPEADQHYYKYCREVLKEAVAYIDPYADDQEFREKIRTGQKIIREKFLESGKFRLSGKIHMIGNSHLDLVFLWPYKEFIRKIGRTHATALRLMEEFPQFIFSQSQPAMYKEMKRHYPRIYQQVKERIKEKRWEVIGGMWVEPDCNLISGESLTRQLLFGSTFLMKEFGIKPRTCWLPDVFGNCFTMPQILAKSGIEYFVTHKMAVWNDTNPWTTNTFWWEGPDGSRVFSVIPPSHFVGTAEPDHISIHWDKFTDKESVGESIYCYGWGDGGGGVDTEMLHYVTRFSNFPGLPECILNRVEDALDSIRQKAEKIPVWKDELYLEAHRGVYTTKGKLKKMNRYAENLYREAEIYSSIAMTMGLPYPGEKLNEGWEKILTNQFHDSLPGSHVTEVYGELLEDYRQIVEIGEDVRDRAVEHISRNIAAEDGNGKPFAVYNSLHRDATTLVYLDDTGMDDFIIADSEGNSIDYQRTRQLNGENKIVFVAENVPAVGYKLYYLKENAKAGQTQCKMSVSTNEMENDFFRIRFNGVGEITSIFDKKANREVIKENGKGNVFKIYEDIPSRYEAWDIVPEYLDRELPTEDGKLEVLENGPVFASLLLTKKFFKSTLRQKIIIYNDIPRIDFETEVDWVERKKLLKVGFDVDVMATSFTSDIAYGNIQRPNYRNNSYEKAKFEVCAHNWIDMSQEDYGVSILNDCKYGFDVTEQCMRVTLLKGPTHPDPISDIEMHYFTYSLYPHKGTWKQTGTNQRGLELNNPPYAVFLSPGSGRLPDSYSFMGLKDENVTLEAVKKAENSDDIIIRVVERFGKTTYTSIRLFTEAAALYECDLMENELARIDINTPCNEFNFRIKPYEIKTFKVVPKNRT